MNCPKCSNEISNVDTFCPACGQFLKDQGFKRKREHGSLNAKTFKAIEGAVGRAIVACPRCGQKLRVPKHEMVLKVTCPKCQTAFQHGSRE